MVISWFDAIMRGGGPRDPGNLVLLWRAHRTHTFWMARVTVLSFSILFGIAALYIVIHDRMHGQNGDPQMQFKVEELLRDNKDQEARIRGMEKTQGERAVTIATIEAEVRQNSVDIARLTTVSMASLVGILAFLMKELLRSLQERHKAIPK